MVACPKCNILCAPIDRQTGLCMWCALAAERNKSLWVCFVDRLKKVVKK